MDRTLARDDERPDHEDRAAAADLHRANDPRLRPARKARGLILAAAALLAGVAHCQRHTAPAPSVASAPREPSVPFPPAVPIDALPPTTLPAADHLVAIGDVHGDVDAARAALRLAGVIDAHDHWAGGHAVVVQTGDALDRGDTEVGVLSLFRALRAEASRAGGMFLALNGNHEIMNAQGDFRYVTPGGFDAFAPYATLPDLPSALQALAEPMRGRAMAMMPGGAVARMFAGQNTVQIVGDTVFVHGGLLPAHVAYGIERINRDVRNFLLGEANLPEFIQAEDSPVWLRTEAQQDDPSVCATLGDVLTRLGARRLVVGHTVQQGGITSACDGRVWRVDVGLARLYGGRPEVLAIDGAQVRVVARE